MEGSLARCVPTLVRSGCYAIRAKRCLTLCTTLGKSAHRQVASITRVHEHDYFDIDHDPRTYEFARMTNNGPSAILDSHHRGTRARTTIMNPRLTELRTMLNKNRVESRPGPDGSTRQIVDRGESRPG